MKKTIRKMVVASLLILAGVPTRVQAQTTKLVYSTPAGVAATTDDTSDENYVTPTPILIANVKTGERLNFGGLWGTQPMTHEVGMPLYLITGTEAASGDDTNGIYYKIGTNTHAGSSSDPGYIGYIRAVSTDQTANATTGTSTSWGHMFTDRTGIHSYDGIVRMIFTQVDTDTNGYPIYTISFKYHNDDNHNSTSGSSYGNWVLSSSESATNPAKGTYYLTATGDDNAVVEAYTLNTEPNSTVGAVATTNEYCQWQIIAEEDLIRYFKSTNDENQTEEVGATFLIDDQNFNRKNLQQSSAWTFTGTGSMTIGCGFSDPENSNQEEYGKYWAALIQGAGMVYQKISVPHEDVLDANGNVVYETSSDGTQTAKQEYLTGWYRLRVKGLSSVASTANAFISYSGIASAAGSGKYNESTINNLALFGTDISGATYNTTGYADVIKKYDEQLIAASSEYATETNVMIYIPDGVTEFYIGVETFSGNGYTLIDDIQLYYSGSSEALILDEDWTDKNLINLQLDKGNTRTLFLQRTLNEGNWNSLLLPVSLTVSQVKEAFGGDTKVCQLEKTGNSGYDIYFSSIAYETDTEDTGSTNDLTTTPLTSNEVLIEAGKMYIIWPSDLDPDEVDYSYTLAQNNADIDISKISDSNVDIKETTTGEGDEATTTYTITGSLAKDTYYQIPLVSLDDEVTNTTISDNTVKDMTGTNTVDDGIYMQGTYVAGASIPQYSYAIKADDGLWYYLKVSGVTSKGYRAWIRTVDSDGTGAHPTMANLFIDDVQVTDGIERVVQDLLRIEPTGSVYSLSGQMVNADGSLEGLPKGIYVKGGKKYVVK